MARKNPNKFHGTSKEGFGIEITLHSVFQMILNGNGDLGDSLAYEEGVKHINFENVSLNKELGGWYEYKIEIHTETDTETIYSIIEYYNGMQRLTKEEAKKAIEEALKEMSENGVGDYAARLVNDDPP